MNLFPWARFRKNKGGIKLHVKLDHSDYIPSFVSVTDAKVHEMNAIREMPLKKGDVIVFDKGYTDYKQYSTYCKEGIYIVTLLKRNSCFDILKEAETDYYEDISFDKSIRINGFYTGKDFPHRLRIIESYDAETDQTIMLLTNHHSWSPETIAAIYKDRWHIEVFFKTIKQNLKIKSFFETTKNAVLTQLWIAMISFLLLKYQAESSTQNWSVGYLLGIIPILLFLKRDIWLWLNNPKLEPDLINFSGL